ncbi:hypothetical protein CRM90_22510 [Mycobacterium sp. ENV421]|uniref:hypothetical protein n=1 Tax=Mycobacterium sp. ENV421 TaxID=1213407 RepID=UPI000C9BCD6F|nr:hypothetical protein [Mycobacterium sp. ENV421]PND55526.1 hypothetical protein CRM90_22510 [Mycobacterium sp. ENV421]
MNRDEVIDVLSAVAAGDRRTVGAADVDVWQAVIGDLPVDLALQAVRNHLRNRPDVWLQPGHVYQAARAIRREQAEREPIETGPGQRGSTASHRAAIMADLRTILPQKPVTNRNPTR